MTDKIVSPELERHMGHVDDKPKHVAPPSDEGPDIGNQLNELLEGAVESVKGQGQAILSRTKEEPAAWLLIAAGVGLALGLLVSRSNRS